MNKLMEELKIIMEDLGLDYKYNKKTNHDMIGDPFRRRKNLNEEIESKDTIKALRDTDYKDQSAYFKMVELLKGLASVSKDDEIASKYLDGVSDALTKVANMVLGSGEED